MIKHDYKPQNRKNLLKVPSSFKIPQWLTHPYVIFTSAVTVIIIAILFFSKDRQDILTKSEIPLKLVNTDEEINNQDYSQPIAISLDIKPSKKTTIPKIKPRENWKTEAVKKGDNLSKIFQRIGLTPQQLHQVASLDDNTKQLKKLRPGEIISYQIDNNNQLIALQYAIDIQNTLYVEAQQTEEQGSSLTSWIENKTIELRIAYIKGVIDDSLFLAGKKARMADTQIMQFAGIFDWDIDFILDVRKGDTFSMIYEEKFLDGEKIGNGDIIAAEFINRGKSFKALRYTDSKNNTSYYTPEGLSMRKAFLRAPVNFKYVSSGFNPVRFHPVLKRIRPHRGIDYVAPVGTPIRAAGDGKVITSGYNKYNGKYVIIQHGGNIVTKYLHLSKRLVSKGKRVKQGQTIGKLGATGMVTGAHLHYEFVVNGVHRNPRTVKLPQAQPIAKSELVRYKQETANALLQLEKRNALQSQKNTATQ